MFISASSRRPSEVGNSTHRLGEDDLRIVTAGRAIAASHRRAPRSAGQTMRDD
ncbi:hypothetical protein OG830_03280 [Streptomyces sp. NBC_00121]|uniref:hypothetical protein n=1 Tax=unclassified Streptomyces TaxID=2593676 RepID=UPI002DD91F4E|nr:hypothetical protein [Streptomyces sp. NBC_01760]WSC67539.1 hypothetical protein OG807_03300 [Streptomyces sp. NBC_01760]WTI85426.1 hypothetical protein OHB17_03885 [Streptomyces sp. NBC_00724]